MSLKGYLLNIINNYQAEKKNTFKQNPLANFIRSEADSSISELILNRDEYKISASAGQGGWAEVPWLGIFHNDVSISAKEGYDIVYLFRADSEGVYLSLNQGFTFYKDEFKGNNPKEKINKVSKYWIAKLNLIRENNKFGFTTNPIDLKGIAKTDMPEGYELGNIYSKYYSKDDLMKIKEESLLNDLDHIKMVFAELRTMLTEEYSIINHRIISNNSIEDLEIEISEKNFDITMVNDRVGEEVPIPSNSGLNKTLKPGASIRKKDYELELKRNTKQGELTEKIAFNIEKSRLMNHPILKDYVGKIRHTSVVDGDGAGYDIQSFYYDEEANEICDYYIEVKSTNGGINTPFFMSDNELEVAREKGNSYSIFRLFKNKSKCWDYYVINDPYEKIDYRAIQYMVIPKSN